MTGVIYRLGTDQCAQWTASVNVSKAVEFEFEALAAGWLREGKVTRPGHYVVVWLHTDNRVGVQHFFVDEVPQPKLVLVVRLP